MICPRKRERSRGGAVSCVTSKTSALAGHDWGEEGGHIIAAWSLCLCLLPSRPPCLTTLLSRKRDHWPRLGGCWNGTPGNE